MTQVSARSEVSMGMVVQRRRALWPPRRWYLTGTLKLAGATRWERLVWWFQTLNRKERNG